MFTRKAIGGLAVLAVSLLLLGATTGCDDYYGDGGYGWGDYGNSWVEPADFSPYGYDYTMYDLFTEDIGP